LQFAEVITTENNTAACKCTTGLILQRNYNDTDNVIIMITISYLRKLRRSK